MSLFRYCFLITLFISLYSCEKTEMLKNFPNELKGEYKFLSEGDYDVEYVGSHFSVSDTSVLELVGGSDGDRELSMIQYVTKKGNNEYNIHCKSVPLNKKEFFNIVKLLNNTYRIESTSNRYGITEYHGIFIKE